MPRHLTRTAARAAACSGVAVVLAIGASPALAAGHVAPPPTAPKKVVCPTVPAGAARTAHLAVQTLQAKLGVVRTGTLWPIADAATWTALRSTLAQAHLVTGANGAPVASASASASASPSTSTSTSAAASPTPSPSASASPSPSASTIATNPPSTSPSTSPAASPSASGSPTTTATAGPVIDPATWKAVGLAGAACPIEPKPGVHGPSTGVPDIDPGLIARVVKALTPGSWPVIPATPTAAPTINLLGRAAARSALAELGVPYRWGGTGVGGWDCSGLAQHAYSSIGIALPRVTSTQIKAGARIPLAQAHIGDLVFWASDPTDAWDVYHVGLYLGSGLIVEAPYTGAKVRITPLRATALVGQVIRPTANLRWPVAPNTTSPTVKVLQRLLHVPTTGLADAATVAAVQAAQQKAALPVTGTADELLAAWLAMGSRAGDGPHTAAELALPRLSPKLARVPGTGPATAKLPRPRPRPTPTASPNPPASPSASPSTSVGASPSPSPSASPSPNPSAAKTSASASPSASAHH